MKYLVMPLFAVVLSLAGCFVPEYADDSERSAPATPIDPAEAVAKVVWEVDGGIRSPESVYFDEASGFLFASNIGDGGATGKDGDGFISKLSLDGQLIQLRWIAGLNAPKGMRSHHGTLWVSDIDQLIGIDIARGEIAERIDVPDAEFLNDVACGADGTVYVSDMMPSRIIQYRDGKVSVFASGEQLEHPNGLLAEEGRLVVAAWGSGIQPDFSTETAGRLFFLDLKTKEKKTITSAPVGNLDGLEADGQDGYLVTDWIAGKVMRIRGDGRCETILQLKQGTADHAYLPAKRLLVLPRMTDNKLTAFHLNGA